MADSDTEGSFDPAALLQMDMEDAGSELSAGLDMAVEPFVDIGADSDTGASDHQTPTKNSDDIQLKSFEDEKQFIALMELANGVSMEEMDARSKFFDMNKTSSRYILSRTYSHCTICDAHVPIIVNKSNYMGHPILKMLVCKSCFDFYGDGNFDRGEDGVDLYCRWCAEGGKLFCCSTCPNVFCKKCIRLNFGQSEVKLINDSESWSCYVCEPKLLWGFRGVYATVSQILNDYKNASSVTLPDEDRTKDLSTCCTYRTDLKQYLKSQNKLMNTYCEGVQVPQIKPKYLPAAPRKSNVKPMHEQSQPQHNDMNGDVSDFFANGHFLEPALPALPPPPPPPRPVAQPNRTIMIRPRIPQLRPVHQLQQRPPTHQLLIRPRNLSNLLQNSVNTARTPPAILMRRSTPTILRTTLQSPRFVPRGGQPRFNAPSPQPRFKNPPFAIRTPNKSTPPPLTPTNRVNTNINNTNTEPNINPTQQWFSNILDQALMSADFYKDEIMKLKLNSMTLLSRGKLNMKSDTQVLNTVKSLNWVMKSMLEQGLDIRRTISRVYPKMDSTSETINMARLHKVKGVPLSMYVTPPPSTPVATPATVSRPRIISTAPRVINSTTVARVNGKNSGDVVDLVSDDEDDNRAIVPRKQGLTITSVHSLNSRGSLPNITRSPLTPTPFNRLSMPATQLSKSPARKRKKKKLGSDDSEDDEDYIPKANPTIMKRRRKSNGGFLNKPNSMSTTPQLLVTNIRSLQDETNDDSSSAPSTTLSYLNQVSEDVMEKVLQLDSGNESSDIEEVDPDTSKDPLDEDARDDWITQNPTAYEKYCVEYNLVKDWYIAVKTIDTSSLVSS